MADKNIQMQILNGSGAYDTLYPKTLGRNTIISDSIASEMGLSSGATVDQALSTLQSKTAPDWTRDYNKYWWRKRSYYDEYRIKSRNETKIPLSARSDDSAYPIYYFDNYSLDQNTGDIIPENPRSIYIYYTSSIATDKATLDSIRGKYFFLRMPQTNNPKSLQCYKFSGEYSISQDGSWKYLNCDNGEYYQSFRFQEFGSWEYISNEEYNYLPHTGIIDNIEYNFLKHPFERLISPPYVMSGEKIGTGTGILQIEFEVSPSIILFFEMRVNNNDDPIRILQLKTEGFSMSNIHGYSSQIKVEWNSNIITLTGDASVMDVLNKKYNWIAFG